MKRSRGRGRRQQNPVNRSYDSNGPDVRVRGTASQVYDKYQALARDAMSAGDRVMAENYRGGPVGLGTLAVAVGEEANTLEEVHEPFLIQEGYLQRTAQGRVLTEKGWQVSGIHPSKDSGYQAELL